MMMLHAVTSQGFSRHRMQGGDVEAVYCTFVANDTWPAAPCCHAGDLSLSVCGDRLAQWAAASTGGVMSRRGGGRAVWTGLVGAWQLGYGGSFSEGLQQHLVGPPPQGQQSLPLLPRGERGLWLTCWLAEVCLAWAARADSRGGYPQTVVCGGRCTAFPVLRWAPRPSSCCPA